jgi:hypothetical protein
MHLIIPYAASHAFSDPKGLASLQLPHLQALLGLLQRQAVWEDPEDTPRQMPHERLQAQALGTDSPSTPPTTAQAWMTPCHWQIGMDQVVMADPADLNLSDEESQQLLQTMQPFLQEDGLRVSWHSALQWHAQGELLAGLAWASLDRVIGQNVKAWMPDSPAARPLQRLQSEMQMLLYNHPVNDAREARRQLTVNAFWLHSADAQTANASPARVDMPDALRRSALHGDATAWQQAWQQLDATAVAALLTHFQATGQATLSLCSEHAAHTYTAAPAAWHQRVKRLFYKTTPAAALAALIAS